MRFWDTSAIVPILTDERHTQRARRIISSDEGVAVWALTYVEASSALDRKRREREIDELQLDRARSALDVLATYWVEVDELHEVKGHALRFLRQYPLRAADALQLGAAWCYVDASPNRREFVVFDGPLVDAARDLGFKVVTV